MIYQSFILLKVTLWHSYRWIISTSSFCHMWFIYTRYTRCWTCRLNDILWSTKMISTTGAISNTQKIEMQINVMFHGMIKTRQVLVIFQILTPVQITPIFCFFHFAGCWLIATNKCYIRVYKGQCPGVNWYIPGLQGPRLQAWIYFNRNAGM